MRHLHKKAGEGGDQGFANDQVLPGWSSSKRSTYAMEIGEFAVPIVHLLGVAAVGGVSIWCGNFRGGLQWNSPNKDLLFNFHPVLMISGFVFLHGEANLAYRTCTGTKAYKKFVHLLTQGAALVLGLVGFYAALKFHNDKGIDNFYSLHSWLGLLTITSFILQWLVGFVTFWYPGGSATSRAAILPWHVFSGLFIYTLSLVTAETGLLEKLTFLQTAKVTQRFGSEAALVNSLGMLLLALGFFVFLAAATPKQIKATK